MTRVVKAQPTARRVDQPDDDLKRASQLVAALDPELPVDGHQVRLDRLDGDEQPLGDLAVRQPIRREQCHLHLRPRQRRRPRRADSARTAAGSLESFLSAPYDVVHAHLAGQVGGPIENLTCGLVLSRALEGQAVRGQHPRLHGSVRTRRGQGRRLVEDGDRLTRRREARDPTQGLGELRHRSRNRRRIWTSLHRLGLCSVTVPQDLVDMARQQMRLELDLDLAQRRIRLGGKFELVEHRGSGRCVSGQESAQGRVDEILRESLRQQLGLPVRSHPARQRSGSSRTGGVRRSRPRRAGW